MRKYEKRKSFGSLMPNIYFSLEVIVATLFLYMALLFDLSTGVIYILFILFTMSIIHFIIKRKKVLNRQNN